MWAHQSWITDLLKVSFLIPASKAFTTQLSFAFGFFWSVASYLLWFGSLMFPKVRVLTVRSLVRVSWVRVLFLVPVPDNLPACSTEFHLQMWKHSLPPKTGLPEPRNCHSLCFWPCDLQPVTWYLKQLAWRENGPINSCIWILGRSLADGAIWEESGGMALLKKMYCKKRVSFKHTSSSHSKRALPVSSRWTRM